MRHIHKKYIRKRIIGSGIFLSGIMIVFIASATNIEFRMDDQLTGQFGGDIFTNSTDIYFSYGGNQKLGMYLPRSAETLSTPETLIFDGGIATGLCYSRVRGLYYNNERGERLRPLDQNTLTGLQAIDSSYNGLQLSGGLFTDCTGLGADSGNVYGQITMTYNSTVYYLIGGTTYDFPNNTYGTDLSGSLSRNGTTLNGFIWDSFGGIGNITGSLICGNGHIDMGETCDDGLHNGEGGYCDITCTESDTVDIPNTGNASSIINEFTAKAYKNAMGAINTVPPGTYVGTKRINLMYRNDGEIIVPFVLQSSGVADKIEMKANPGLVVEIATGVGFTGILNNPEPFTGTVSGLSGVLSVVDFDNNQDKPLYFKDLSGNPTTVELRIPVSGGKNHELVNIYSSQDGTTWTPHTIMTTYLQTIGGIAYARIPTTHATIFAIVGGGTGTFVINNDDASTTSDNVTLNIYGSGVQNMRFINDSTGGTRSARETFATGKARVLTTGYGMKTVYAEFDTDGDTGTIEASTSDDILYTGSTGTGSGSGRICASGSYCGDLTFQISSGISYCEYGKTLDFGKTAFSYTTHDLSTGFVTSSGNAKRFCQDNQGLSFRNLSIQSSDLVNITTNNPSHTIPAANVYIKNPSAYLDDGMCTEYAGNSANSRVDISSSIIILGKASAYGEGCRIATNSVDLKVTLPGAQAIGQYSGTLTINLPNF